MSIARQLYQLQEVDLELESYHQALARITSQLGESEVVVAARNEFSRQQQHLEELRRQQRSAEWEIDDFANKLAVLEEKLYSGRIKNPKELTNLQHEVDGLKSRRQQVEEKALGIMEQALETETKVTTLDDEVGRLETEWHSQQQQLLAEAERHKVILADLEQRRQLLLANIESSVVTIYEQVRKQKGRAVVKVERGTCRGCGISLSTAQLQQARGTRLVRCGNCGRILISV